MLQKSLLILLYPKEDVAIIIFRAYAVLLSACMSDFGRGWFWALDFLKESSTALRESIVVANSRLFMMMRCSEIFLRFFRLPFAIDCGHSAHHYHPSQGCHTPYPSRRASHGTMWSLEAGIMFLIEIHERKDAGYLAMIVRRSSLARMGLWCGFFRSISTNYCGV